MGNTKLTLRDLEEVVNALAKQHQELQERMNRLEKIQARLTLDATEQDLKLLKKANNSFREIKSGVYEFCGSQ